MKNPALAQWLEHCSEFVRLIDDQRCMAVFEGVLHLATTGQTDMLDSIVGGAARSAVALGQTLETLLASIQTTKLIIWGRLEAEIDPERVWDRVVALEIIFQTALTLALENYAAALLESHRRQMAESARLSREAEQKVMAYAAQLARANRELARLEQAKTDFISIAAHELKTPLTVLQGYIDILLEQNDEALAGAGSHILTGLAAGTERLADIVNDLLDVSAIETGSLSVHPETTRIEGLVRVLQEQVSRAIRRRGQHLETALDPELPPITTDAQRLHQVLERLLNNAIKYTPDGGTITLSARLEARPGGDCIKIEVADTGIGISPEDKDHIFDKFYRVGETDLHSTGRVKFKGAGPGLGLSIARGIIKALNGQIWVDSPGYDEINCPGSTFHLRLPLAQPD